MPVTLPGTFSRVSLVPLDVSGYRVKSLVVVFTPLHPSRPRAVFMCINLLDDPENSVFFCFGAHGWLPHLADRRRAFTVRAATDDRPDTLATRIPRQARSHSLCGVGDPRTPKRYLEANHNLGPNGSGLRRVERDPKVRLSVTPSGESGDGGTENRR